MLLNSYTAVVADLFPVADDEGLPSPPPVDGVVAAVAAAVGGAWCRRGSLQAAAAAIGSMP